MPDGTVQHQETRPSAAAQKARHLFGHWVALDSLLWFPGTAVMRSTTAAVCLLLACAAQTGKPLSPSLRIAVQPGQGLFAQRLVPSHVPGHCDQAPAVRITGGILVLYRAAPLEIGKRCHCTRYQAPVPVLQVTLRLPPWLLPRLQPTLQPQLQQRPHPHPHQLLPLPHPHLHRYSQVVRESGKESWEDHLLLVLLLSGQAQLLTFAGLALQTAVPVVPAAPAPQVCQASNPCST